MERQGARTAAVWSNGRERNRYGTPLPAVGFPAAGISGQLKEKSRYCIFFSKDGKAIQGTYLATIRSYLHADVTESVGSMGCVGLTAVDATVLYKWPPKGTLIVVIMGEPEA